MVQALSDDGIIVRNGSVKVARSLSQLRLPPTVQGILAARIDRLPAQQKELLQTLAVMGRESALGLIRQVAQATEAQLERVLADLLSGEFIYELPVPADMKYVFKHALTQEVAYNSLLIERRKLLHERAGRALETMFGDRLDDHLSELARHYGHSANADKAVQYLTLAGKQALGRAAFSESHAELQQGLEWVKTLPESAERFPRELELASALVQVLTIMRGYSAPETVDAAEHASGLAEKTGNLAQLILQLSAMRAGATVSGDHPSAAAIADQMLDLAQRDGSPTSLGFAHFA
jgi:predicted ATPase